jgi:hypothetical protein
MGKINETQARAKEILEIKRRNETNLQERFSHTLQVIPPTDYIDNYRNFLIEIDDIKTLIVDNKTTERNGY